MAHTDQYLTRARILSAWYVLYDLEQSSYASEADRGEFESARHLLNRYYSDDRIPAQRLERCG